MKRVLIIGATSAIAVACARLWAGEKASFFLAGRQPQHMTQIAGDLTARGAEKVTCHTVDFTHVDDHAAMLKACVDTLGHIDIALVCYGTLPDQEKCDKDMLYAQEQFMTNGLSAILLLGQLANVMEQQGEGTIVAVSSVAGDRGRKSNYLYGSAKAAVSVFCAGLRGRLQKKGVHVLLVKPGFVATPMTAHLALPSLLTAQPKDVACDIVSAVNRKKAVLYTPCYWWLIMVVIRCIPEAIFKRLSL